MSEGSELLTCEVAPSAFNAGIQRELGAAAQSSSSTTSSFSSSFRVPRLDLSALPADWSIGLVIGPSGSGKTALLRRYFGEPDEPTWSSDKAVVSEFGEFGGGGDGAELAATNEAIERLSSVGLGSIPTWMRPFACLSNGEGSRARLARQMKDGAVVDDFTHVVNRHAAWAMSNAVGRFVRKRGFKGVVFATSCADVVPWLQPDWLVRLPTPPAAGGADSAAAAPPAPPLSVELNDGVSRPAVSVSMTYSEAVPPEEKLPQMWGVLRDGGEVKYKKLRAAPAKLKPPKPEKNPTPAQAAAQAAKEKAETAAAVARGDKLLARVALDTATERASEAFDYEFGGESVFAVPRMPAEPFLRAGDSQGFGIGLLVGPSGSGKTTLLKQHFGGPVDAFEGGAPTAYRAEAGLGGAGARSYGGVARPAAWDDRRSVAEQVSPLAAADGGVADAAERLRAVALPEPAWLKPFCALSTGERFLAQLARAAGDFVVIDEFSSTVDRPFARRVARRIAAFCRRRRFRNVVFATCHEDVVAGLEPDWVFSTQVQQMALGVTRRAGAGGADEADAAAEAEAATAVSFAAPRVSLQLMRVPHAHWSVFREFHYLDTGINTASPCYTAWWTPEAAGGDAGGAGAAAVDANAATDAAQRQGRLAVGIVCTLPFPGSARQGVMHREHRCVVLPDFQGLGFGTRISDKVARAYVRRGMRYQSRTAHPRFGTHRGRAEHWVGTSGNLRFNPLKGVFGAAGRAKLRVEGRDLVKLRVCYSHEYVGDAATQGTFAAEAGEACADLFQLAIREGRKRDAKVATTSLEALREAERARLQKRAANKRQAGKVRFSKGGTTGPNKLVALVASGQLRAGDGALELPVYRAGKPPTPAQAKAAAKAGKASKGGFAKAAAGKGGKGAALPNVVIATEQATLRDGDGAILWQRPADHADGAGTRIFGDVLTFVGAAHKHHGVKEPKTNADCWKLLRQHRTGEDGATRTLSELRGLAAAAANKLEVNPRSVKEWAALREGDLGKIRRLGGGKVNLEVAGSGDEADEEDDEDGAAGAEAEEGGKGGGRAAPKAKAKGKAGGSGSLASMFSKQAASAKAKASPPAKASRKRQQRRVASSSDEEEEEQESGASSSAEEEEGAEEDDSEATGDEGATAAAAASDSDGDFTMSRAEQKALRRRKEGGKAAGARAGALRKRQRTSYKDDSTSDEDDDDERSDDGSAATAEEEPSSDAGHATPASSGATGGGGSAGAVMSVRASPARKCKSASEAGGSAGKKAKKVAAKKAPLSVHMFFSKKPLAPAPRAASAAAVAEVRAAAASDNEGDDDDDDDQEMEMSTDDERDGGGGTPAQASQKRFARGLRVEVEFNDEWFGARILRVRARKGGAAGEELYDVDYGKGEAEDNVTVDRLRFE